MRDPSLINARRFVASVALVGLFGGALAGCGGAGATRTGSSGSGAPQNCGSLSRLGPATRVTATPPDAESCFLSAAHACQPATLTYIEHGIDDATTSALSVTASGPGCVIGVTSRHTIVGATGQQAPAVTYTCSGAHASGRGIALTGCGKTGDITIPPAAQS